jgi:hypothetical protein
MNIDRKIASEQNESVHSHDPESMDIGVGAVSGDPTDNGVADADESPEDRYWRANYSARPYVAEGSPYEKYRPAYQHGWEARARLGLMTWHESEPLLRGEWESMDGSKALPWTEASGAIHDAFEFEALEPGGPVHRVGI